MTKIGRVRITSLSFAHSCKETELSILTSTAHMLSADKDLAAQMRCCFGKQPVERCPDPPDHAFYRKCLEPFARSHRKALLQFWRDQLQASSYKDKLNFPIRRGRQGLRRSEARIADRNQISDAVCTESALGVFQTEKLRGL